MDSRCELIWLFLVTELMANEMNFSGKLSCGLQTIRAHLTGRKTPLVVYLYLTARCNLKCSYCNYPNMDQDRGDELSTTQILKLIDEMVDAGTKKLQLTGGEPFLRRDIGEIVLYAKNRGLYTGISASGLAIPERIDEIKSVDVVYISLDGDMNTHDSIRGKGSYSRAVKAIDILKEHGVAVWTTTVINRKNTHSIDWILDYAERRGLTANFVLFYHVDDYEGDHLSPKSAIENLSLTNDENKDIVRSLIVKKRAGRPIGSSQSYFDYLLNWDDLGELHGNDIINGVNCWAGKLFCHVDSKGMLYPCGTSYWRVKGYNTIELGFAKAFALSNDIPCKSCVVACHLELNQVFSLKASPILNWTKIV